MLFYFHVTNFLILISFIFREQPIFSIKAHVFEVDPKTKKKWLAASTQAINVSYYYDNTRNSYRIISVEGTKVRTIMNDIELTFLRKITC